jgi:hypothetical protein
MSLLLTQVGAPPAVQVYAIQFRSPWFDWTPDAPPARFTVGYQITQVAPTVVWAQTVRPAWFDDPAPLQGRITTGYAVTTTVAPVIFAGRIVPALFPVELLPTGKIATGYIPPAPPVVPTLGWRITPAWQPDPLPPVGRISTGYVVAAVIPPVTPTNTGGRGHPLFTQRRPINDDDDIALILALIG